MGPAYLDFLRLEKFVKLEKFEVEGFFEKSVKIPIWTPKSSIFIDFHWFSIDFPKFPFSSNLSWFLRVGRNRIMVRVSWVCGSLSESVSDDLEWALLTFFVLGDSVRGFGGRPEIPRPDDQHKAWDSTSARPGPGSDFSGGPAARLRLETLWNGENSTQSYQRECLAGPELFPATFRNHSYDLVSSNSQKSWNCGILDHYSLRP